jgi:hypothetical protein
LPASAGHGAPPHQAGAPAMYDRCRAHWIGPKRSGVQPTQPSRWATWPVGAGCDWGPKSPKLVTTKMAARMTAPPPKSTWRAPQWLVLMHSCWHLLLLHENRYCFPPGQGQSWRCPLHHCCPCCSVKCLSLWGLRKWARHPRCSLLAALQLACPDQQKVVRLCPR